MTESIMERVPILAGARKKRQEDALAKYFLDQFNNAKQSRSVIERQWYLNYAFTSGRQNVQYIKSTTSTTNFRLFVPNAPPWRVRLVINRVRSILRKELSKTTANKPIFTVVPETTEEEDVVAARAAEQIFQSAYGTKEIQTVLQRAAFWRGVTGVGYIKTWWDSRATDPISNQQGDICIERIRPFNIIVPDLLEEDIEKQPWIIHAWTMTPEDAQDRYALAKLPEATINASADLLEESVLNLQDNSSQERKEVLILEVWIKKHPDYPNGGLVTIVGNELAQNIDQYPYEHGEYPIAKMDHIPTGKFYAESVITDLIAPQRELNRTRSQIVENKNLTSRPRFIAERGSVDVTKISGEPGQILFIMPGTAPPVPMETPSLPNYVMQHHDQLLSDLDDLSGQHEISRGSTPNSQITAATAISFLQEQDDSILAPTIESQEAAIRKIGRQYLALAHQYWSTDRTVKVVGDDGYFDALIFKGSSIKGTKINKDVRVESGSSLSYSKAAKQAIIMDLMKNGLIDPQTGLRRMEFGGVEKLFEEMEIDRRQATRENLKMAKGEIQSPNEFDNHAAHIEIHNRYRKTQEFEMLDPMLKKMFELHVMLHKQADFAMQQQQLQMMQAQMPGQSQNNPLAQQPPVGNNGLGQQVSPPLGQ